MIPEGLDRLVLKCEVPVVVADAAKDDAPLIIVNDAFCEMTGYTPAQVLGTNCRFLQPSIGAEIAQKRIKAFLEDDTQQQGEFVIPNVRKDGSRFLNLLHLSKLTRPNRAPLILGSQFDVTTQSTEQLGCYCAALNTDTKLIGELTKDAGWSMTQPRASLSENLEHIARFAH